VKPPADTRRDVRVRPAPPADTGAIAAIDNQGIADRVATLETAPRTAEERRAWLADRGPRHPVIVAEAGGAAVGWASLNRFNPRGACDHVTDLSVYVERQWRGRGVGRALLEHLMVLATRLGYHKIVLAAFPCNAAGVALYGRLGFREVASIASRAGSTGAGCT
jgi:phosphinothricin acetyltransferase